MSNDNIFFDPGSLAACGKDVILGKTVRIRKPGRVEIGDHSIIDDFTYISCGLVVGRYSHIGANSTVIGGNGNVRIGDFVNIAPACRIICVSNDYSGGGLVGPAVPEEFAGVPIAGDIVIEDHVLLGVGTVILPGTHVPQGVSTGAMTLLGPNEVLKPWILYAGTPARALKPRESSAIIESARKVIQSERNSTRSCPRA
jgi:acetyltransferase-like isoleucine patch superfamily enzyme